MTTHAAWSGWMTFIIIMAMMGPFMRFVFRGGGSFPGHRGKRVGRGDPEEIARLDAALAERDVVIEDLQRRLSEMESRLDFTERLLAQPHATAASGEQMTHSP